MEESLIQNARAFAALHGLQLAERLGFGIHGIVLVAENNPQSGQSALKAHRYLEPYQRERAVYERLHDAGVTEILGFHVPQFLRADDQHLVIEMTIVTRPFVLDFAGAYLDAPPDFSEAIWAEWEVEKREQFEGRWAEVQAVLGALEALDIHMVDVSPSNISF